MKAQPLFSIRRATLDDAAGILECLRLAFEPYRDKYSAEGFRDTVLTAETLPARLKTMCVFVAITPRNEIIGTIGCAPLPGQASEGHIRGMAVRPEWQGMKHGVAGHLLAIAEQHLRREGCKRVSLDTTAPLKRAIRFYSKHGYRASGTVGDFFGMPLHEYLKEL